MQLPPHDELVLVSSLPPIRAKKLRYYEDRNFTERVVGAPALAEGLYRDRPTARADDWSGQVRAPVDGLVHTTPAGANSSVDDGGLQQQRHPGLTDHERDPSNDNGGRSTREVSEPSDDPLSDSATIKSRTAGNCRDRRRNEPRRASSQSR